MDTLRGRSITGSGTADADWRQSAALRQLASVTLPELLGKAQRLVVVAPHPDDEVLGCGGLMAMAVAAGVPTLLLALTDGEAAYPDSEHWEPQRLGPLRRSELTEALKRLHIMHPCIQHADLGDGQIRRRLPEATEFIRHWMRAEDCVLVTSSNDGHPDHEAAADATLQAAREKGAHVLQYPIWTWHWSDPQAPDFAGRARRLELPAYAQSAKAQAIEAFRSQTGNISPPPAAPILPPEVLLRFRRPYEVYLA